MFAAAESALRPLSVPVANAEITGDLARSGARTPAVIENALRVNTLAPIGWAQAAIRRLSIHHGGSGGAIVFMSSIATHLGGAGALIAYAVSKNAIEALITGPAQELADEGIRVNGVAPGIIDTDMPPPELRESVDRAVSMRRPGDP